MLSEEVRFRRRDGNQEITKPGRSIVPSPRIVTPHAFTDFDTQALVDQLAHTGALLQETVSVPWYERGVDVIRPTDIETLLDQSARDPEQNLPYWAEIWPSGIALAGAIAREPARVAHQPVIELGSGLGITAAVALAHDARLVATDYAHESTVLTRLTCRLHTHREPDVRQLNWRSPGAGLLQPDGSRWPIVLAADVLYEERDVDPLLAVFECILAPGGMIWLAEPGRRPAELALRRAEDRGWEITTSRWQADWPDPKDAGVVVRVHQIRIKEGTGC